MTREEIIRDFLDEVRHEMEENGHDHDSALFLAEETCVNYVNNTIREYIEAL